MNSVRMQRLTQTGMNWPLSFSNSTSPAKVKLRGRDRVDAAFTLALAAHNMIQLPKVLTVPV